METNNTCPLFPSLVFLLSPILFLFQNEEEKDKHTHGRATLEVEVTGCGYLTAHFEAPRSTENNTGIGKKKTQVRDEKQETLPRRHEKRVEVFVFACSFLLYPPFPEKS
jgi:hypothetical protein